MSREFLKLCPSGHRRKSTKPHLLRRQAGFTLIELVVSLGVAAALAGVLGGSISGLVRGSRGTITNLAAVQDIQRASKWLLEDIARANQTNLVDGAPATASAQFTWRSGTDMVTCAYSVSGTELQRQCPTETVTVARYISALSFTKSLDLVTIGLTSRPPGDPARAKSRTLMVYVRGD